MRRDTKIFNLNHNNNSIVDLSEKSSLRDIARGTQLRRCPGAQKKSSQDYLQQGLAKIIKLTVDVSKIMGIIISVSVRKGESI
jgi:hypothetical protein